MDLEVKASTLGPSAGVGVFVRQKIGRNTLLTEYGVDVVRQLLFRKWQGEGRGRRDQSEKEEGTFLAQAAHICLFCVCLDPG